MGDWYDKSNDLDMIHPGENKDRNSNSQTENKENNDTSYFSEPKEWILLKQCLEGIVQLWLLNANDCWEPN